MADELGYIPNKAGRGLRTGQTNTLSLVLAPHAEIVGYTAAIIGGLEGVCREHGYELSATPDAGEADDLSVVRSVVESGRADGMVLSRTEPQDLRVKYLLEKNFPFITHGRTELATPHASVDFDNELFAEQAAERLIAQGRRTLMLIGAPSHLMYHTHLRNGFNRVVKRNDLPRFEQAVSLHLDTPLDELRHAITTLYQSEHYPDGIVCAGEIPALAIMAGIRDAGRQPGKEVNVIAKQTSVTLDHMVPAVDSYFEDIYKTGQWLGELLLQKIAGNTPTGQLNKLIAPIPRLRLD